MEVWSVVLTVLAVLAVLILPGLPTVLALRLRPVRLRLMGPRQRQRRRRPRQPRPGLMRHPALRPGERRRGGTAASGWKPEGKALAAQGS